EVTPVHRAVEPGAAERVDAAVEPEQPVARRGRIGGDADDRAREREAQPRRGRPGRAAERQDLPDIRSDPVTGAAQATRHLRTDRRQHRLDALPGAISCGSVAMAADVEQILAGTVRREIET